MMKQDEKKISGVVIVLNDDWLGLINNIARALANGDTQELVSLQKVLTASVEAHARVEVGTWTKLLMLQLAGENYE